ncbi:MAG: hypothetical protein AAF265_10365 [Pseudomonadota bacterium]
MILVRRLVSVVLFCCLSSTFAAPPAESSAPVNPALIDSPWPTYHAGPARQASTQLRGPDAVQVSSTFRYFEQDAGERFGTSPWHILSAQKYSDSRTARAVWGVSLKYLYKYVIDGDRFEYVDHTKLNNLPFFIGWNFFGLSDGRIVVPNPSGLRVREHRKSVCAGKHPSLLVYRDGSTSNSSIECQQKFEFSPTVLDNACGFRRTVIGTTPVAVNVTYSGEIAVQLRREVGRFRNERRETWMAILDNALTRIIACEKIAEGASTNGVPMLRDADGRTHLYIATDDEIVHVSWDPSTLKVTREAATPLSYRGRTGTTPTIVSVDDQAWLVTIDARCAVTKVFSGAIECDADDSPSRLVAVPIPLGSGESISVDLPDFIDTVENSPAAAGGHIVVANYSGYTPDGKKDGKPDRATGIVALRWDSERSTFIVDWSIADLQISGVPTISTGSNVVYGSGSEPDGNTYFYGLRLVDDEHGDASEIVVRALLGPSKDSKRGAGDAIYDAGNNILINDDGSTIMAGGESLIRIRDE